MGRTKPWRVRVRTIVESWVDVQATTAAEAERQAQLLPGVVSVFGRSAIRADRLASDKQLTVED